MFQDIKWRLYVLVLFISYRYPFLSEDSVFRPSTAELFGKMQAKVSARLKKVFAQQSSAVTEDIGHHNAQVFVKV